MNYALCRTALWAGIFALALPARAATSLLLAGSAADTKPLAVGAVVPPLVLKTFANEDFDLTKALGEKTTVLIFFRGGWCPYCSQHLGDLAKLEPQLVKMNVQIIAISTDRPNRLRRVADANGAHYRLLSDRGMTACSMFGVAYLISPAMRAKYADWNIDVPPVPGDPADRWLPVPAAFVIGRDRVIKFAYSDPDYTVRIAPATLLRAVEAAQP